MANFSICEILAERFVLLELAGSFRAKINSTTYSVCYKDHFEVWQKLVCSPVFWSWYPYTSMPQVLRGQSNVASHEPPPPVKISQCSCMERARRGAEKKGASPIFSLHNQLVTPGFKFGLWFLPLLNFVLVVFWFMSCCERVSLLFGMFPIKNFVKRHNM